MATYVGFQEKIWHTPSQTEPSFRKLNFILYITMYGFSYSPPAQGIMSTKILPVSAPRMEPSYTHPPTIKIGWAYKPKM